MEKGIKKIESDKLTKFYRRKNLGIGRRCLFLKIKEHFPYGKVKVDLYYDSINCPYWCANYVGTTIIELKDIIYE